MSGPRKPAHVWQKLDLETLEALEAQLSRGNTDEPTADMEELLRRYALEESLRAQLEKEFAPNIVRDFLDIVFVFLETSTEWYYRVPSPAERLRLLKSAAESAQMALRAMYRASTAGSLASGLGIQLRLIMESRRSGRQWLAEELKPSDVLSANELRPNRELGHWFNLTSALVSDLNEEINRLRPTVRPGRKKADYSGILTQIALTWKWHFHKLPTTTQQGPFSNLARIILGYDDVRKPVQAAIRAAKLKGHTQRSAQTGARKGS